MTTASTTLKLRLMTASAAFALVCPITPAIAQTSAAATEPETLAETDDAASEAIVVTGSRIRRSDTETSAPVFVVDQQSLTDRGFVSAAQALNNVTSIRPALNQAAGDGSSAGNGQQFPNLFNLGPGRTLTLINGRRMVTSSSGLGDSQVDANIIPVGLLERVEIVEGGGAAVYGSDAIAGVVNYILRKNFSGIELDLQTSLSSRGDYPVHSLRATLGQNFAEGRGNFAVNIEYSQSPILRFADRPLSNLARITQTNAADTGPNDGIPSVREIIPAHFWNFNNNGVIFTAPAPPPNFLARLNGNALQFAPDGSVVTYDPGTILGIPFAQGGQGFRYSDLAALRTGVERLTVNALAHYDITDNVTLNFEFLAAKTTGSEIPQGESRTVLNSAATNAGAIAFTINNPFLSAQARTALSTGRPGFAAGAPLFLSKIFTDLVPSEVADNQTQTYRGLLGLEGKFSAGERDFYWSASGSYARVEGGFSRWRVNNARFNNAINAVRTASGSIVCAINADASTANDDPNCAPINPFGNGNVSEAARRYVSVLTGQDYVNIQKNFLATFGGDLVKLPGGTAGFSLAYEHRDESARFTPFLANQLGTFGVGTREIPQAGGYNTDEFSAELLVPLIGGDFTLPLVQSLEVTGAYRHVDNSVAGKEDVWNVGVRWKPIDDITLRGSRGRNFRAPTLTQLFAPSSSALSSIGVDPCDADRINAGPNPAQRRASCLALFRANPLYGTGATGAAAVGASAEVRLATFQNPSENFTRALVTTGGNPNLRNEISDTLTFGIVIQPRFIPGLTITADRVKIDLEDGLSAFATDSFAAACYDDPNPDPAVCAAFTRLAAGNGTDPGGTIITGTTTTFNAGVIRYRGENYNLNYAFPLASVFGGDSDLGRMEINVTATHNTLLTTSVTGTTFTRTDGTVQSPEWVGRLDVAYTKGPLRLTYQLFYLDEVLALPNATIENNPNPVIGKNITHSISAQLDIGNLQLRGGITNLTDRGPSYPNISYGDILGRQFFVGARMKF